MKSELDSLPIMVDAVSMADRVMQFSPATDAEALKLLRASFPDSPLSVRVAALNMLMQRQPVLALTRH
jgi:hypothetical protein